MLVGVEGRVLNAVAVNLPDIEVFFHFRDVARGDAVGCAPDSWWGGCVLLLEILWLEVLLGSSDSCDISAGAYMVCQRFPELAVDERYDAAGVFWCAAVILAISISVWFALENVRY